jgi:hypothetical protein
MMGIFIFIGLITAIVVLCYRVYYKPGHTDRQSSWSNDGSSSTFLGKSGTPASSDCSSNGSDGGDGGCD